MPLILEVRNLEIYKITNNINDKKYIGQTVKTFNERYNFSGKGAERVLKYLEFRESKQDYYTNKIYHNNHLLYSMRKYGVDNFSVEIIDNANSKEELNRKEIYWIDYYKSFTNGYNKNIGGSTNSGWIPSEETRKLWSKQRKGKHAGEKNPNYGVERSEETRNKIGLGRKGQRTGLDNPKSKPVINLDTLEEFNTITEAKLKYNASSISNVCKGKQKKSGGYRWMYIKDYENESA